MYLNYLQEKKIQKKNFSNFQKWLSIMTLCSCPFFNVDRHTIFSSIQGGLLELFRFSVSKFCWVKKNLIVRRKKCQSICLFRIILLITSLHNIDRFMKRLDGFHNVCEVKLFAWFQTTILSFIKKLFWSININVIQG